MDADKIRKIFLLVLGLTYIGLGIFMYIKQVVPISPWGEILSIAFVLYGSWRVFRALAKKSLDKD
jgi:hypothetical protein